jgi:hypothetical protein
MSFRDGELNSISRGGTGNVSPQADLCDQSGTMVRSCPVVYVAGCVQISVLETEWTAGTAIELLVALELMSDGSFTQ